MDMQQDVTVPHWCSVSVLIISIITSMSGLFFLAHWLFYVPFLKLIFPSWASVKPNGAICLIFAGLTLWLLRNENTNLIKRYIAYSGALVILLISAMTFSEYIFKIDLGIDQLLFSDIYKTADVFFPGRMSLAATICFSMTAIAFLLLDAKRVKNWLFQVPVGIAFIITLFGLLGYAYNVDIAYNLAFYTRMAAYGAIILFLLNIGILLSRPERGVIQILFSNNVGGQSLRLLLPSLFFIPLIIGYFETQGERYGLYETEFGDSILLMGLIITGVFVAWFNAWLLNKEEGKKIKTEEKLNESEVIFREFAENIEAVFWQTAPNLQKTIYVSPAYEKIWGRSIQALYNNPREWLDAIVPEDKDKVANTFIQQLETTASNVAMEYRIIRPDGTMRYIYDRGFPLRDKNGKLISTLGIATDVTAYKQAIQSAALQQNITTLLERGNDVSEITSKLLRMICAKLDWDLGEVWLLEPNKQLLRCIDTWHKEGLEVDEFLKISQELMISQGIALPGTIWQTGQPTWLSDLAKHREFRRADVAIKAGLNSAFGVPVFFHGKFLGVIDFFSSQIKNVNQELIKMLENIATQLGAFIERKYSEEQIIRIANYDILTSLLNRASLEEIINNRIMTNQASIFAVLMFDIDRFKLTNEAMGHDAGDELLRAVAQRVQAMTQSTENVAARLGGDKFLLLLLQISNTDEVINYAHKIFSIFKLPFQIHNHEVFLNASIGIAIYPQNGNDSTTLLKNADIALMHAKEQGGNTFQFCTPELPILISEKIALEVALRRAIPNNELALYYQPQIALKTGEICGVETLIRWFHPEKGLLAPHVFIPLAEETDLIITLGEWALQEVFRQIKKGWPDGTIAVNLSAQQFRKQYNLISYIEKLIQKFNVNPANIELEITESMLVQNTQYNLQILTILKDKGFNLTLDDFGIGFSSFTYLLHVPTKKIKIDKSFIDDLPNNTNNVLIVKTIITLAHSLGMEVVAEGVETAKQVKFLMQEGCDIVQGFYFAEAMPIDEVKKLISTDKKFQLPV